MKNRVLNMKQDSTSDLSKIIKHSLKYSFAWIISILWAMNTYGQISPLTPNWGYLRQIGSSGIDEVNDVTMDPIQKTLITGTFSGTTYLGFNNYTSIGGKDGYFLIYGQDAAPYVLQTFTGPGDEIPKFVGAGVGQNEKVSVAGTFTQTARFNSNIGFKHRTSAGQEDVFVAFYNDLGDIKEVNQIGGPGSEDVTGMYVSSSGSTIVIGTFSGTIVVESAYTANNVTLTSAGGTDIFYVTYSPDGHIGQAKRIGGPLNDFGGDISHFEGGNSNEFFISGSFGGTVKLGSNFSAPTFTSTGTNDLFVAKFNFTPGEAIWAKQIEGGTSGTVEALSLSATQNGVLLTGTFTDSLTAGTNKLYSAGQKDIFLANYNLTGTLNWTKRFGGKYNETVTEINASATGESWISGYFSTKTGFGTDTLLTSAPESGFITAFSNAGNPIWVRSAGGTGSSRINGLALTKDNNVMVAGNLEGTAEFWPNSYTSAGLTDGFMAKLGQGEYCYTLMGGSCSTTIKITNVSITGTSFNNSDPTCGSPPSSRSYTIFPPSPTTTATIIPGSSFELKATSDTRYSNLYAWVDFNRNWIYEASEFTTIRLSTSLNVSHAVTIQVPGNALPGPTGMRVMVTTSGALVNADEACVPRSGDVENYTLTIGPPPACTTPISAGNISGTLGICSGKSTTLNLSGQTLGTSLQWQSSSNGTTWTNITGATNVSFATPLLTSATFYRVNVTCGTSTVPTASVHVIPAPICYCSTNLHSSVCSGTNNINSVSIAGTTLNNANSGCTSLNGQAYSSYPASGSNTTTLLRQGTYNLNVTSTGNSIMSVWIDYNQNGAFEVSEWTQITTSSTAGTAAVVPITIPSTAVLGLTGMRIRSRAAGSANGASDACTNFASGETEDYTITIGPACNTAIPTISANGATTFCAGGSVTLSAASSSPGATYQWLINGNTITGATSATYNATVAGSYTVVAYSGNCIPGTSTVTTVTINPAIAIPVITTSSATTICAGDSVVLTGSSTTTGVTYQWLLNGTAVNGATAATLSALIAGDYSVVAINASGCSDTSTVTTVTLKQAPATPTITRSGNAGHTLNSSAATGNQWILNGQAISGATNQTYQTTANGTYAVLVTTNGCTSDTSAAVNITNTGISADKAGLNITIYPNPTYGKFDVKLIGYNKSATINLYSLTGQLIYSQEVNATTNEVVTPMNIENLAAGTYLLKVVSEKGVKVERLIVK